MRWQTKTIVPEFPFEINHGTELLLLGSCFAEHIGARLEQHKFKVTQNPFGIIYNPLSLLACVEVLTGNREFHPDHLEKSASEVFFSYLHHSRYSSTDAIMAAEGMNRDLIAARQKLNEYKVVFISLGSSFYWWHKEKELIVNNCHKQSAAWFEERRASGKEVLEALKRVTQLFRKSQPDVVLVFTVSPVRHLKHGSIQNQLSKALLIAAVHELAESSPGVHYFPSYELLLDDLRDYRFYEEDLIHPNKQAIDYIWEAFCTSVMPVSTQEVLGDIQRIRQMLGHRFLVSSPAERAKLTEKLKREITELEQKCGVSFWSEFEKWVAENS
jgi:hypothetical protein